MIHKPQALARLLLAGLSILVAGMHLAFSRIGHARKEQKSGYAWVPAKFAPLATSTAGK